MWELILGAIISGVAGIFSDKIRYIWTRKQQASDFLILLGDLVMRLDLLRKQLDKQGDHSNHHLLNEIMKECNNYDKFKDQMICIKDRNIRVELQFIMTDIYNLCSKIVADKDRVETLIEGYWDLERNELLKDTESSSSLRESIKANTTKLKDSMERFVSLYKST